MKALSIVLLALTTGHAAMTGDVTALTVAFILFCYTCGKDVVNMWNKILKKNNEVGFKEPRENKGTFRALRR